MFDFVLCMRPMPAQPSAEFAEGLERLRVQAGPQAQWLWGGPDEPWAEALARLPALAGDSRTVLLLAHAQVLLASTSVAWLRDAVADTGVGPAACGLALCWGGAHLPPDLPPNYATVRGLERYARTLRQAMPAQPARLAFAELPRGALVAASTVGALAHWLHGGTLAGAWWPGCFAHDFSGYHQGHEARRDMLGWVPPGARRVLDVGGGEGHFLALLRAERGCETHLSEFSPSACAQAAQRVDHAWPGDFLQLQPAGLPEGGRGAFDCITFLDSLEHAPEPGRWLNQAHALLRADGCIVGSVPHVGHWTVVADLLEGRWDYCPVGIHCNTHLRFFTRRTLTDLLERHGFAPQAIEPTLVPTPAHWRAHWLATPGLDTMAAELDAYAFVFQAVKAGTAGAR